MSKNTTPDYIKPLPPEEELVIDSSYFGMSKQELFEKKRSEITYQHGRLPPEDLPESTGINRDMPTDPKDLARAMFRIADRKFEKTIKS